MTIELRGQLTLDVGKKIIRTIELGKVHESAIEHCLTKGFDALLRDSHANATLDAAGGDVQKMQDEAAALVDKKINSIYAGELRIRGEGRASVPSDPIAAEAEREARVTINKLAKAHGAKWYEGAGRVFELPHVTEKEQQALRDVAWKARAVKPENVEAARKIVEARNGITISADDLGF